MPPKPSETKRFLLKFKKTGNDECWEWNASRYNGKYGQFKSQVGVVAHRFSYFLYVGDIPDGIKVLHKCDNPGCVNPNHLFLGTNADNTKDMVAKGRSRFQCSKGPGDAACKGEDHGRAKLTEADIRSIRKRYRKRSYHSSNAKQLAMEYGVSQMHITRIVKKKKWTHI